MSNIFRIILTVLASVALVSCHSGKDNPGELYKRGVAEFEAGDYASAVELALESLDHSRHSGDRLLEARSHELLADSYRAVYNMPVARSHRLNAIAAYRGAAKPVNAFYATMDLAGEYSLASWDSARYYMDKAHEIMPHDDPQRAMQHDFMYAEICRVNKDYPGALSHFRKLPAQWLGENIQPSDSVHIGEIYYHNAMPDSALAYFSTSAAADDVVYWECMADWNERNGNLNGALICHKNLRELGYEKTQTSVSNALETVERQFYQKKAAQQTERNRRLVIAFIITLSAGLVAVLAWLMSKFYRRSRELEIENEIKDVALMETKPDADSDGMEEDKWVNLMLDFYMSRLNEISREYFKAYNESRQREIEMEFRRELKLLRGGDIFDEIERRLNEEYEDIVIKIRKTFPKFSEQYVRLMLCHLARLSSQSTCLLLSMSKGNYYVQWTRIRSKIKELPEPDRELFSRLFLKK